MMVDSESDVIGYVLALVIGVVVFSTFALSLYVLYDTRKERSTRRRLKEIVHLLYRLAAVQKSLRAYPNMSEDTKRFQLCFLARHFNLRGKIDAFKADHPDSWKDYLNEYKVNERFGPLLNVAQDCETRFTDDDLMLSEPQLAAAGQIFLGIEHQADELSVVFRRIRGLEGTANATEYAAFLRRVACHELRESGVRQQFDTYLRTFHGNKLAGLATDHVFWISAFETLGRFPDVLPGDLFDASGLLVAPCRPVSAATTSACRAVLAALRYYLTARDLLKLLESAERNDADAVRKLAEIYGPNEGNLEAKIRRYHELAGVVGNVVVPTVADLLQAYMYHVFELTIPHLRRVITYRTSGVQAYV